jgi:hypothetical protein
MQAISKKQQRLIDWLVAKEQIRLVAPGTDPTPAQGPVVRKLRWQRELS